MTQQLTLRWHDYSYFPYERRLARREVEDFLGATIIDETEAALQASVRTIDEAKLRRLTYFRAVTTPNGELLPDQALLEFAGRHNGEQQDPSATEWSLGRQSTRYSTHGLHEYRGKFNPQIVRTIGNLLGLDRGSWVLDPYVGSGTTLLESDHSAWNAAGVDMNPLAVKIANAKLTAVDAPIDALASEANDLLKRLAQDLDGADFETPWDETLCREWISRVWPDGDDDRTYLESWFPLSALAQLALMLDIISNHAEPELQDLFRVVVSDIAREVSLQDPGDLRIRRRKDPKDNYPAFPLFRQSLTDLVGAVRSVDGVGRFQSQQHQRAFVGDSREPLAWLHDEMNGPNQFDAAITSPPYASALPYIDTQRLSLAMLGLTPAKRISKLEREIIGSRELRKSSQNDLERQIESGDADVVLPQGAWDLCRRMKVAASREGNGFRRRAMPAVTFRYLRDSAKVMRSVREVVKPGGHFALVVGQNRTTLGGEEFLLDTPSLLAEIGETSGWRLVDDVALDTYPRFDLHQANSIKTERLIVLRNPM